MTGSLEDGGTQIVPLTEVAARRVDFDWPFRRERAADVGAHWAMLKARKPAMFNGQVLLQCRSRIVDGVFHAEYFETDFASFIGWRDLGRPQSEGSFVRNGFAMGALRSSDGAFLMGEMAPHTVNAGQVYFAAGTPDPSDLLPDGTLDLAGSLLRELEEETGLAADEVAPAPGWTAVMAAGRVAFMREVTVALPADEARALMLARLARQEQAELSDIVIVRGPDEIDPSRMPLFMRAYLARAFA